MADGSGAGNGKVVLLARIDAVAERVDTGDYLGARVLLRGWRSGADVTDIPGSVLDRAQQWVDGAYAALSDGEPDPLVARNALLQIRRALTT